MGLDREKMEMEIRWLLEKKGNNGRASVFLVVRMICFAMRYFVSEGVPCLHIYIYKHVLENGTRWLVEEWFSARAGKCNVERCAVATIASPRSYFRTWALLIQADLFSKHGYRRVAIYIYVGKVVVRKRMHCIRMHWYMYMLRTVVYELRV